MIKKFLFVTFIVIIAMITATIFFNSAKPPEESYAQSNSIGEMIKPMVPENVKEDSAFFGRLIRKGAHAVEFFALGVAVSALMIFIRAFYKRSLFGLGAFYITIVPVIDEFIQNFTGRTSSVNDIIIDLTGAVFGILTVAIIFATICLIYKLRRASYEKNQGSKN